MPYLFVGIESSGNVSAGTATTLRSTYSTWTADQWKDYAVYIDAGAGLGQNRRITTNSTDTLTISPAWSSTPSSSTPSGFAISNIIPVMIGSAQADIIEIGDRHRAFSGRLRSTVRSRKSEWRVRTPPLAASSAETLEGKLVPTTQPVKTGGDLLSSTGVMISCDVQLNSRSYVAAGKSNRVALDVTLRAST